MKMLKRAIPVILAAMLALSLTACNKDDSQSSGAGNDAPSSSSQTTTPGDDADDAKDGKEDEAPKEADTMSEKDYIAKVEELNTFAEDFTAATMEFVTVASASEPDIDEAKAAIEKIRDSKEGFLKFGEISNPPADYAEVHTKLSKSTKDFGDLVDKYADVLLKALDGEEDPALNTIESEVETVVNQMVADITEVEAIYNK